MVTAKIDSIFSIGYYMVVKAHSANKKLTILSKTYDRNVQANYKDSCLVKKGKKYKFILQQTSVIKVSKDENMLINLRSFDIGEKHFLNAGELPYIALNMFNTKLYK